MIKFSRFFTIVLIALFLTLEAESTSAEIRVPSGWLVGTWKMISDEDNGALESIVFREDGIFATYDNQCKEHTNSYFVRKGLVFLVVPQQKGPIALILVPSTDRTSLTFTSPRTQNNAVYKRTEMHLCQEDG